MGEVRETIMCMQRVKQYRVGLSTAAMKDIERTREYIFVHFKYRSYAENYLKEIKKAVLGLAVFPEGYEQTEFNVKVSQVKMEKITKSLHLFEMI